MQIGEEIEIEIDGKSYFLQPDYERTNEKLDANNPPYPFTVVFDSENYEEPKKIFVGTCDEVLNFSFNGKYTLRYHFNKFKFI